MANANARCSEVALDADRASRDTQGVCVVVSPVRSSEYV